MNVETWEAGKEVDCRILDINREKRVVDVSLRSQLGLLFCLSVVFVPLFPALLCPFSYLVSVFCFVGCRVFFYMSVGDRYIILVSSSFSFSTRRHYVRLCAGLRNPVLVGPTLFTCARSLFFPFFCLTEPRPSLSLVSDMNPKPLSVCMCLYVICVSVLFRIVAGSQSSLPKQGEIVPVVIQLVNKEYFVVSLPFHGHAIG